MKILSLALLALLTAGSAHADPFDDFNSQARPELIKPFALDLGGILGGATLPNAKPLGFPGFSVGMTGAAQVRPDKDNLIMRNSNVKGFGLPFVEAAVGLPFGVDVLAHGSRVGDLQVLGGGLRYGIFKSGLVTMAIPSLSLSGVYNQAKHDYFKADHYAANAGAIWSAVPVLHPFVQVGVDSTKVKVTNAVLASAAGASAKATGYRASAGVDFSPFPLLHIHGVYSLRHGIPGADFGMSLAF